MLCCVNRSVLALSVAGLLAAYLWLSGPSYDDLRRDGDRMALAVDRYRSQHGRYPETLEEAGIVAPECPYDGWRYYSFDNHYRLSVGDDDRDGFVLTYRSVSREWELSD